MDVFSVGPNPTPSVNAAEVHEITHRGAGDPSLPGGLCRGWRYPRLLARTGEARIGMKTLLRSE